MNPAIAIFCPEASITERLKYVTEWIFKEQLQVTFQILSDKENWQKNTGFKINYSSEPLPGARLWIKPFGLLEANGIIRTQMLNIQRWKRVTVLCYNQPGAPVPFDLFSAVFFLISRYEEYLPYQPDKHQRFPETASVAGQYNFLSEPVIDQWLFHFRELLTQKGLLLPPKKFQWEITYDIDMAWKYLHRGSSRYWGGHVRDFFKFNIKGIKERFQVVSKTKEDPYFSFQELEKINQKHSIYPLYFFLLGTPGKYDRNIFATHPEMQQLISHLGKQHELGIHPSYGSHSNIEILKKETGLLSSILNKQIIKSRQHFIKFTLPETYRNLIRMGIQEDYSMGYASSNGFRAGTSCSYFWYDLKREETTGLRIFPFAFMDATSRYYLKQRPNEVLQEWKKLFLKIEAVQGSFISIWHNYILSRESEWIKIYEQGLDFAAAQKKPPFKKLTAKTN